jgi:TFIIF-interacting CTD phosphatase-like protein
MKKKISVKPNLGILSCIVLDLDETLVHTHEGSSVEMKKVQDALKKEGQSERFYSFKLDGELMWGVKRPYYQTFLAWCRSQFDIVAVWTAGDTDYAEAIVSVLFEDDDKPDIIWARPECVRAHGTHYKPMDKFFSSFPEIDRDNTVIIDDRADVAEYNPDILVEIPKYNPNKPTLFDNALISTVAYLRDSLKSGSKLRFIPKEAIF